MNSIRTRGMDAHAPDLLGVCRDVVIDVAFPLAGRGEVLMLRFAQYLVASFFFCLLVTGLMRNEGAFLTQCRTIWTS